MMKELFSIKLGTSEETEFPRLSTIRHELDPVDSDVPQNVKGLHFSGLKAFGD
jgi:hypothetical protein